MHQFPRSPRHDPVVRPWRLRQHRDVFQEMPVRVAEEDRRGGHPGEDHWLVRWPALKVEWRYAGRPKRPRGSQHIGDADAKRRVRGDLLRCGARSPESEHCAAGRANPEERHPTRRLDVRELQPDHVLVERDRGVQVGYRQVHFEQAINRDHDYALGRSLTRRRRASAG
jgi:hypothetical protein